MHCKKLLLLTVIMLLKIFQYLSDIIILIFFFFFTDRRRSYRFQGNLQTCGRKYIKWWMGSTSPITSGTSAKQICTLNILMQLIQIYLQIAWLQNRHFRGSGATRSKSAHCQNVSRCLWFIVCVKEETSIQWNVIKLKTENHCYLLKKTEFPHKCSKRSSFGTNFVAKGCEIFKFQILFSKSLF